MTHAENYRSKGLGQYIREAWQSERINPPQGGDLAVWQWLNRVDVAWHTALSLVPDSRLLLVAGAGMARTLVRFVGEPMLETVQAIPLAAYGLEQGRWRAALVGQNAESIRRSQLPGVVSGPGAEVRRPQTWQDDAFLTAHHINQAMALFNGNAPGDLVRSELGASISHAWQGWRRKLETVDGMAPVLAKTCANQVLLVELRQVINPGLFGSVFLWARREA